jgi:hypothetical protein
MALAVVPSPTAPSSVAAGRGLCYIPARMNTLVRNDLYFGLFTWQALSDGGGRVTRHEAPPQAIPCPDTGRSLKVATLQAATRAICPSCQRQADGGFVSFVSDLRLAYACPACRQLIWVKGA